MRHVFRVEDIDRCGSNWQLGTKMCNFDPKVWIFGKRLIFILEKGTFFFAQLSVVARTWLELTGGFFWGPKSLFWPEFVKAYCNCLKLANIFYQMLKRKGRGGGGEWALEV